MDLESWFLANKRSFPWRKNPTPYAVWVSEVMLQQTRAQVVICYFERWMEKFPTIQALAIAPLDLIIKSWEGLGYYNRARNLHVGAQKVVKDFGGNLPSTEEELLTIPGLGSYTVGAILSFGFHKRAVAVDGNVARVATRLAWISEEIGKVSTKRKIEAFVEKLLSPEYPWITAEALIELGATICTPVPRCEICPLRQSCISYAKGQPTALPIKAIGPKLEKIIRGVALLEFEGQFLIRKNPSGQLMGDLWEFPYFEGLRGMAALKEALKVQLLLEIEFVRRLQPVEHAFTRFLASLFPFHFRLGERKNLNGFQWITKNKLLELPFSSGHRKILLQM